MAITTQSRPQRWDEPFGRTSLEACSRGCATIISNKGGLPETTRHPIILKQFTKNPRKYAREIQHLTADFEPYFIRLSKYTIYIFKYINRPCIMRSVVITRCAYQ